MSVRKYRKILAKKYNLTKSDPGINAKKHEITESARKYNLGAGKRTEARQRARKWQIRNYDRNT